MNLLLDTPPESVIIDGREYPVNWGYRAFILIEICMFDSSINEEQRLLNALNIFYNRRIPDNMVEAVNHLYWFYMCGERKKKEDKNKSRRLSQVQRCYDFEQDAPYIYAAFLTQYRLDLSMTLNYDLHWWKFRAMFESLDENLKISKIMYYRTAKTTGMSKQQRNVINIMKSLYALESQETSADSKMKLAKRNLEMKEYVRNRMKEVKNAQES